MPHWILSTRAHSIGGPVAPVKVLDADRPGFTGDLMPELLAAIQGRDVFFATHGFEVNQADGISHLGFWLANLEIGNAVPIGIVWPGDCVIPIFVDYILEGREAIKSGQLLATFLNANFTGAVTVSFASRSAIHFRESLTALIPITTQPSVVPARRNRILRPLVCSQTGRFLLI